MVFTIVLVLMSLVGLSLSQSMPEWTHRDESAWPAQCREGREQSPINIVTRYTHPDLHETHIRGPLQYRGYDDVMVTAKNTGYKVRWAVSPGTPAPVLAGGPLRGNYTFAEVHFHWLSEHAINGIKYPLEIHLVHFKYGLTAAEALARPDGVAVIGIFAQVGTPHSSAVLDELIPAIPYIQVKSNEETRPFNINVTKLFSPRPQEFYTYHGSLTTPGCPEVVTWIVMNQPTLVSHENYKNLTSVEFSGVNNDRSVQPTGLRLVYRSKGLTSCSHAISPSSFGALAAMMTCFASKVSSALLGGMCSIVNLKKRLFGKAIKECEN